MLNNNKDRYYLIERKAKELIKYIDAYTRQFPKYQKYVLGERLRNQSQDLIDLIITINKKYYKKTDLTLLDVRHEQLRVNTNISYELELVEFYRYNHLAKLIDELGKMIGGWIKSINSNENGKN